MEQATNQFSKGLQSDSHPMIQGNDTLTDCLNGTLVTMNGNELVLQNDMGNRRIDHANLPEGYEPVGIKEYGGIIYIACYNPITNRGQIGSFPSPERRKGTEYPGLETSINLNGFIELKDNHFEIKKNTLLFPLTEEITLHAGDQFKLSFVDSVQDIIHYIVKQGVRNPLFTLKVGILNSQNEFVDITEDLKQYNIGPDEHPINYFISPPGLNQQEQSYTTIDDETFIKNRLADQSVNTYSYKIVSPLYLQATINTFTRTDVSCYAEVTNKNNDKYTCDFELTVNYEHDCPFNDSYKPIIIVNGNPVRDQDITIKTQGEEEYISKFGDLKSKVVYTFSVNNLPQETNLKVKFPLIHDYFYEEDSIIVDTQEFDLDLEKVGSDTIEFNGYKYYNYDNYTNLKLDLTTYPKRKNSKLKNLYIVLYNWQGEYPIMGRGLLYEGDIPSGVTEFTFEWPEEWKRRCLGITIDYGTDIKPLISRDQQLMFITTELFNDNYNGTEEFDRGEGNKYIDETEDYKYNYLVHRYAKIDDYRKIKKIILTPTVNITSKSNNISSIHNSESSEDLDFVKISEITTNDQDLNLIPTIYNKELYPEMLIQVDLSQSSERYFDDSLEKSEIYVNDILVGSDEWNELLENLKETSGNYDGLDNINVIDIQFKDRSERQGSLQFTIEETVNNFWRSSTRERNISILNLITNFNKFLEDSGSLNISLPYFSIDCEHGGRYISIQHSNLYTDDPTSFSDSTVTRLNKTDYKGNEDLINSYISGITNDLFIGEYNTYDYIYLFESSYIDTNIGYNILTEHFRRIWMRYEQNKYIPVGVYKISNGENAYDFSENLNSFKSKIPHLYVYNPNSQSIKLDIADLKTAIYNKEFNDYSVKLVLTEVFNDNVKFYCNNIDENSIFELVKNDGDSINITLNQSNIKSDERFIDMQELIKSDQIECAYVYNNENSENNKNYIKIFDNQGDLLDSKYVYKCSGNNKDRIIKSYIPTHKFSVNDFYQIPHLLTRDKHTENVFRQYDEHRIPIHSQEGIEGVDKLTFALPDIYDIPPYDN